jgi:hypothetical protein
MRKRKLRSMASTALVVLLPVSGVVLTSLAPNEASLLERENDVLHHAMALVDEPSAPSESGRPVFVAPAPLADTQRASGPPRGAPIDAPAEGDAPVAEEELPDVDGVPWGGPRDADAPTSPLPKLEGFNTTTDGRFFKATFERLSDFRYRMAAPELVKNAADPMEVIGDQIPKHIRALHEQPVVTVGYMLPLDVTEEGNVTLFALTQTQSMCCYGVAPELHQWAMVTVPDGIEVPIMIDLPVAVYGKMEVGEELEDGYIVSLYRITASEVLDVQDLLRKKRAEGALAPKVTPDAGP